MSLAQLSSIEAYREILSGGGWRRTLDGRVLGAVCDLYPCTRREVAYAMDVQASTISGAVNRLVHAGLVADTQNPGDRPCSVTGRHTNLLSPHEQLVAT